MPSPSANVERARIDRIVRIVRSTVGLQVAWLGLANDDTSVAIGVQAGDAAQYLQGLTVSWADMPEGRGPTGMAIRSGQAQVNNLQASEAYLP